MVTVYFRVFRTRGWYANFRAFRRVLREGMANEVAPDLVRMFNQTTVGWKVRPTFVPTMDVSSAGITIGMEVTGKAADVWFWNNYGVEERVIRPSRARRRLRIAARKKRLGTRYRRDTKKIGRLRRPMAIKFTGPGGDIVFRHEVRWPGIQGKFWNYDITEGYAPTFYRRTENMCRRAVRAAQREGR